MVHRIFLAGARYTESTSEGFRRIHYKTMGGGRVLSICGSSSLDIIEAARLCSERADIIVRQSEFTADYRSDIALEFLVEYVCYMIFQMDRNMD